MSPSYGFLSISSSTLTLSTSTVTHAGTWNVDITVGLSNYAGVATRTVSISVEIICDSFSLSFSVLPSNPFIIRIGIDAQPSFTAFTVAKQTNCTQALTFVLSGTVPGFVSLQNVVSPSGKVQVSGVTNAEHGSYPMTLTALDNNRTVSALLTVQIKNPCSYAVFETTPAPITNMTVDMANPPTELNQAVIIYTDIQRAYAAIVCPITATLAPNTSSFVSLSTNQDQIKILTSQITKPTDYGNHNFTLTVNSLDFSGPVAQKIYSFTAIIKCTVTALEITDAIQNHTYIIRSGNFITAPFEITQSPNTCNFPLTLSASFTKQGAPIT